MATKKVSKPAVNKKISAVKPIVKTEKKDEKKDLSKKPTETKPIEVKKTEKVTKPIVKSVVLPAKKTEKAKVTVNTVEKKVEEIQKKEEKPTITENKAPVIIEKEAPAIIEEKTDLCDISDIMKETEAVVEVKPKKESKSVVDTQKCECEKEVNSPILQNLVDGLKILLEESRMRSKPHNVEQITQAVHTSHKDAKLTFSKLGNECYITIEHEGNKTTFTVDACLVNVY